MPKKQKKDRDEKDAPKAATAGKKGKSKPDPSHTGYRYPEGDFRCKQYGPEDNGFMTMGPTGQGGVIVWVGDNSQAGWTGWPNTTNPVEYWWFSGSAFPQADFDQYSGSGSPPAYGSHAWLRFPLLSWDASTTQPQGLVVTVDGNDSFYRITGSINGTASPGTFYLHVVRNASGIQWLRWIATGLATNQESLFPPGAPWAGRKLAFVELGSGTWQFDPGVRAFAVAPL